MKIINSISHSVEENPFGLSIGDLMASLLLIIILLLSYTMLNLQTLLEQSQKKIQAIDQRELLKKDLIIKLTEEFKKYDLDVTVDNKSGAIVIGEKVLFDTDRSEVKTEGVEFLKAFTPIYAYILLSNANVREQISQVIVEGHTDKRGSYKHNLNLSLARSANVVNFIFSEEIGEYAYKEEFKKLLNASGRSFMEPRDDQDTLEAYDQNRRVEFKFRLKDWDMFKGQQKNMKLTDLLHDGAK